ncbi:MAG: hypothetical protein KGZ58_01130 [Ignavibacteriales bacterium]|nr:hypothetical protein [Ignavibacteriales bacterium]
MSKNYYEKISIQNGGLTGRCQECKKVTGLRFVTEIVNMCPQLPTTWQNVTTFKLCDRCADMEKRRFQNTNAEVIDGRELNNEFRRPA